VLPIARERNPSRDRKDPIVDKKKNEQKQRLAKKKAGVEGPSGKANGRDRLVQKGEAGKLKPSLLGGKRGFGPGWAHSGEGWFVDVTKDKHRY